MEVNENSNRLYYILYLIILIQAVTLLVHLFGDSLMQKISANRINEVTLRLEQQIDEKQNKIDELKRELEELKRKE